MSLDGQRVLFLSTFDAKESKTLRFLCSVTSALTMDDAAMGQMLVLELVAWSQVVAPLQCLQ